MGGYRGFGKISELTVSDLQTIAAKIGKKAKEVAAKTVAISIAKRTSSPGDRGRLDTRDIYIL